jgi:hypothetical protein
MRLRVVTEFAGGDVPVQKVDLEHGAVVGRSGSDYEVGFADESGFHRLELNEAGLTDWS